jgi:hypothetical protein
MAKKTGNLFHRSLGPLAALGFLVGTAGCGGGGGPASFSVTGSREVGVVPQSGLIQGHDGGASALLFGHSVWIYGDTPLNVKDSAGIQWHSNSFAVTDDLDPSDGIGGFWERLDDAGAPMPLVANTAEEATFIADHAGDDCRVSPCGARWAQWPGSAVFDAARNRALVWYGLVYAEPGSFNFHGVGQSLAIWQDFAEFPKRLELSPGSPHPTLLFGENEPGFGAASAIDGEDLYAFACDKSGFGRPCLIGRVPAAHALERSAWTYWDGESWSAQIGDAHPVFDGGLGLSVFRLRGKWVAVYAASLSSDIKARTADTLVGPWSSEVALFTADRKGDDSWTYDAYVHSELTPADESALYVSFTRPNHQGWFGSETVLVRVDIAPLTPRL